MRREPMCEPALLTRLQGHRIVVLGRESTVKERLTEELQRIGRQAEVQFDVSTQTEISPEDYVILMGTVESGREKTKKEKTGKYPWIREEKGQGEYLRSWTDFMALSDTLQSVRKAKPAAAVFVSDSSVYGKLFGEPHLIREEEIGYLCHTDEDSQDGQILRTTEHLCARLAREDGVNICIARLQCPVRGGDLEDNIPDMTGMLLRVLLSGAPGEPYNIQGPWQVSPELADVSPLSPNIIVEELAKAENL